MCSVLHIFCSRSRWLPVLSLSLRTSQRWKYRCSASQSAVSRLDISSCFPCLKTFILLALLTPFSRPSAHDWILCWSWDIMDGCCDGGVPASHVILSLWGVGWGWPKVLPVCGMRTSGTFSWVLLSWAWGSYHCLLQCSLLSCLLSSCLTLPVVSLYNTTCYQREMGQPKIWLPVGAAARCSPPLLPGSALAVCTLCLRPAWSPKEGCSSSSLRLGQEQGWIEDLGLLRWPASGFHF